MVSGDYAGVGEIAITHFDKGFKRQHVLEFSPTFEPFLQIVDLIGSKGMWLDLHAEPVDPRLLVGRPGGGLAHRHSSCPTPPLRSGENHWGLEGLEGQESLAA